MRRARREAEDGELGAGRTVVGVLSGDLGNGIADLVSDATVVLDGQDLQELLANSLGLFCRQRDEDFHQVALVILARLGCDPSENNSRK